MLPYASSCCRKYHASVAKPCHLSDPQSARLESRMHEQQSLPWACDVLQIRNPPWRSNCERRWGFNDTLGCWKIRGIPTYCSKQVPSEGIRDQQHPDALIGAAMNTTRMRRHLDEVSEATGISLCVGKLTGSYIPLMIDDGRVASSGEGFVIIKLPSPYSCGVVPKTGQKKCEIDAADGDTASRLIGRAGKVGRLSGNGLAISKRPSI